MKRRTWAILAAACVLCLAMGLMSGFNRVEWMIVRAIDRQLSGEGVCELNLAELFSGEEWDTVSIFVAGNEPQIREALGIENDISDGILFSRAGQPVMKHLSCYQFSVDEMPRLSYGLNRVDADDPYYVSLPRESAVVRGSKHRDSSGQYKYSLSPE